MHETDQPMPPGTGPGRRHHRARIAGLCGIVVAAVAIGAGVLHDGSDRGIQVAANGPDGATDGSSPAPVPTTGPEQPVDTTTPSTATSSTGGPAASTSTTAKPATSTTKPPATTTTSRTGPAPTTTAETPDDDQIALPAGGVAFPYEAGRSVWEATSNGYTIRVQVDPGAPRGGQVVNFAVTVSGPGPGCCRGLIGYDGHMAEQLPASATCAPAPNPTFSTSYVYNTTGRVRFKVLAGDCPWARVGWLAGWLDLGEGRSSVQGPARPTVELLNYGPTAHDGDFHWLPLFIKARDADGWIDRFTVDWGDGTAPETLPGDPIPCRAVVPYAWPTGDYVSVPASTPGATSPLHHYDNPGTYTVTVTARSTACDGSQPQEATGTRGWSVP